MSALLRVYRVGRTTVEMWGDSVRTILPSGNTVVAAPGAPPSSRSLAACLDHEMAHTWLAWCYTGQASLVMRRLAAEGLGVDGRRICTDDRVAQEEQIVLAYCAGLLPNGDRPWDEYLTG